MMPSTSSMLFKAPTPTPSRVSTPPASTLSKPLASRNLPTPTVPSLSTASSVVPPTIEAPRFLLLPRKIRRRIYRYVFLHDIGRFVELPLSTLNFSPDPSPSHIEDRNQLVRSWLGIPDWADRSARPRLMPPSCQIGILLTSWQTYLEAAPILYHERQFYYQLGSGRQPLRTLDFPRHSPLYNEMKHIIISIIWENASSEHIKSFLKIFASPVPRSTFLVQIIVLNQFTIVEIEKWFIDAIAGLNAFENVFFCMRYPLDMAKHECGQYERLEKGVKHTLGPAVEGNRCLNFRPKHYNDEKMRAQRAKRIGEEARYRDERTRKRR